MSRSDIRSVLSPEARVLLNSTSAKSGNVGHDTTALLDQPLEWGKLYGMAVRERALGPLWAQLESFSDRLPEEFSRSLEQAAVLEGLRQLQLEKRLEESLRTLRDAGITPMLLKGAALLQTCYRDVRERPMADIDLLVEPAKAEKAREALLRKHWTWDRDRFPESMYSRHYHLPPLQDTSGSGIGLELHTGLFVPGHPLEFGPETLRAGAGEITVAGGPVLVPHPEDHLLYLCLHFAWSHALRSGAWRTFRDVRMLIRDSGFDWGRFVESVEEARGSASAYWTLRLMRELAGGQVPEAVMQRIRPPLPEAVLGALARHYCLDLSLSEASCPSTSVRQWMWILGNRWGRRGSPSTARERPVRPWEYSGDFQSLAEGSEEAERGIAILYRHLDDRGKWLRYLRRVVFPYGSES